MKTEQKIRDRLQTYKDLVKEWESIPNKGVEEDKYRDYRIDTYIDNITVLEWVLDEG